MSPTSINLGIRFKFRTKKRTSLINNNIWVRPIFNSRILMFLRLKTLSMVAIRICLSIHQEWLRTIVINNFWILLKKYRLGHPKVLIREESVWTLIFRRHSVKMWQSLWQTFSKLMLTFQESPTSFRNLQLFISRRCSSRKMSQSKISQIITNEMRFQKTWMISLKWKPSVS